MGHGHKFCPSVLFCTLQWHFLRVVDCQKRMEGFEVSLLLSSSRLCSFLHSDPQATYHFYILSYFNMYKSLFAQLQQKLNPLKHFSLNLKHLISKLKYSFLNTFENKSAKVSGKMTKNPCLQCNKLDRKLAYEFLGNFAHQFQ